MNNFDKVMMNVLSNAFKFTPDDGIITVKMKSVYNAKKDEFHTKNYLEIVVSDSGTGIDEEDTEKIFERFYQSENNYMGKNAGNRCGTAFISINNESFCMEPLLHETKKKKKGGQSLLFVYLWVKEHLSSKEINTSSATKESVETIIEQPISLYEQPNPVPENKIKPKTKFQVLIVEDDDEIRNYLKNELSSYFKVEEATNGKRSMENDS